MDRPSTPPRTWCETRCSPRDPPSPVHSISSLYPVAQWLRRPPGERQTWVPFPLLAWVFFHPGRITLKRRNFTSNGEPRRSRPNCHNNSRGPFISIGGSDRLWLLCTTRQTSAPALPTLSCLSDNRYVYKTLPRAGLFLGP